MLNEQPWIKYSTDIHQDWKQACDEGKDVRHLEDECLRVTSLSNDDTDKDSLATNLYKKLYLAKVDESYSYIEPSTLEEIRNQRPSLRPHLSQSISTSNLENKILGAWLGRISGCLLGKPVEGYKTERLYKLLKANSNYPLACYISPEISDELKKEIDFDSDKAWLNTFCGAAPADDDTNYTVLALKIVEKYGKNFTPSDVAEAWLQWMPMLSTCTAERVAYKNLAQGIIPPESATFMNPYREWIGAQIRADFWGYINPGNPELAAEMAWRDASISHVKNGIYGEMFVSAMLAAAATTNDILLVIETGLGEIPLKCRLAEKIQLVLSWFKEEVSQKDVMKKIHQEFDEYNWHHWCHTISNAMIVVFALLYGNKELGRSICLAVEAGFDTDCNGATTGSIVGMMIGAKNIPVYWTEPFNNLLHTTIEGYNNAEISILARKPLELIEKL